MWIPIIYLNHDVLITFQEEECVQKQLQSRGREKKCRKRQKCTIQDLNMAKFQRNGVENGLTICFATCTVMEKVSANEDEDYTIEISSKKRFNEPRHIETAICQFSCRSLVSSLNLVRQFIKFSTEYLFVEWTTAAYGAATLEKLLWLIYRKIRIYWN